MTIQCIVYKSKLVFFIRSRVKVPAESHHLSFVVFARLDKAVANRFRSRMCNLYRFNRTADELRIFSNLITNGFQADPEVGNLAPAFIGADQDGSVLRRVGGKMRLSKLRWGFPPTKPKNDKGKWAEPITNIRNLESRWWRDVNREWMLEPNYRCLVPFTRFAEPNPKSGGKNAWFATETEQSFFAGVWRPWSGDTRLIVVEGKNRRARAQAAFELYSFLTTAPNQIVKPVHDKAMPVILTEPDECEEWLAGGAESFRLQRPVASDKLKIVHAEQDTD